MTTTLYTHWAYIACLVRLCIDIGHAAIQSPTLFIVMREIGHGTGHMQFEHIQATLALELLSQTATKRCLEIGITSRPSSVDIAEDTRRTPINSAFIEPGLYDLDAALIAA